MQPDAHAFATTKQGCPVWCLTHRRSRFTLISAIGSSAMDGPTNERLAHAEGFLNMSGRSVERHIAKAVAVLSLEREPLP